MAVIWACTRSAAAVPESCRIPRPKGKSRSGTGVNVPDGPRASREWLLYVLNRVGLPHAGAKRTTVSALLSPTVAPAAAVQNV